MYSSFDSSEQRESIFRVPDLGRVTAVVRSGQITLALMSSLSFIENITSSMLSQVCVSRNSIPHKNGT